MDMGREALRAAISKSARKIANNMTLRGKKKKKKGIKGGEDYIILDIFLGNKGSGIQAH